MRPKHQNRNYLWFVLKIEKMTYSRNIHSNLNVSNESSFAVNWCLTMISTKKCLSLVLIVSELDRICLFTHWWTMYPYVDVDFSPLPDCRSTILPIACAPIKVPYMRDIRGNVWIWDSLLLGDVRFLRDAFVVERRSAVDRWSCRPFNLNFSGITEYSCNILVAAPFESKTTKAQPRFLPSSYHVQTQRHTYKRKRILDSVSSELLWTRVLRGYHYWNPHPPRKASNPPDPPRNVFKPARPAPRCFQTRPTRPAMFSNPPDPPRVSKNVP